MMMMLFLLPLVVVFGKKSWQNNRVCFDLKGGSSHIARKSYTECDVKIAVKVCKSDQWTSRSIPGVTKGRTCVDFGFYTAIHTWPIYAELDCGEGSNDSLWFDSIMVERFDRHCGWAGPFCSKKTYSKWCGHHRYSTKRWGGIGNNWGWCLRETSGTPSWMNSSNGMKVENDKCYKALKFTDNGNWQGIGSVPLSTVHYGSGRRLDTMSKLSHLIGDAEALEDAEAMAALRSLE